MLYCQWPTNNIKHYKRSVSKLHDKAKHFNIKAWSYITLQQRSSMLDLNKYFFEEGSVLIFTGKAEGCSSSSVETPDSNPLHEYDFFFPYFLCYHKSWDTVF